MSNFDNFRQLNYMIMPDALQFNLLNDYDYIGRRNEHLVVA